VTEAVTMLIQKEGDKVYPLNRRPAYLFNIDYEILMKYINKAIVQPQLETIINHKQLCAVKCRYIQEGLCLIRDVLEYSRKVECNSNIVSLGQEKAFDLVAHEVFQQIIE
jgi:hypothetical protein